MATFIGFDPMYYKLISKKMHSIMNKRLLVFFFFCFTYAALFAQKTDTLTTASDIKYYFLKKGDGPALKPGWLAIWHYQLNLVDGTKIDASRDRGAPLAAPYPSRGIIEGVTEALSLMHIGDRAIFVVPSSLGYGDKGWGTTIPPKSTLVFDMELLANKEKSLGTVLDSVLFGKPVTDTTKIYAKEAIDTYKALKKQHFKDLWVSEDDLNTLGYEIMKKFPKEAVEFLKLNAQLYPKSWNVYDSLGDGYMALGNNKLALKNYQIAVKLDPQDSNGLEMIKKLTN